LHTHWRQNARPQHETRESHRLALTLGAVLAGVPAAANAAEVVTPGQTVISTHQDQRVAWSTPAVHAKHAKIENTVHDKDAAAVITLRDASAPTRYDFALSLPTGASALGASNGSVIVLDQHGSALGSFSKPWAKDANGKSLATEYNLFGSTLTQVVHTNGASFPVTADPKYTWGWATGTAYYNRSETHNIATGSLAGTAVCGGLALVATPAAGAACLAAWADINFQANRAWNQGQCVKLKYAVGSFLGAYVYSGGYCR
jgi:hypothetical protein